MWNRRLLCNMLASLVVFILCASAPDAVGAEEGWRWRHAGRVKIELPEDWFPMPDADGGWGFFTGGVPESGAPGLALMMRLESDRSVFQGMLDDLSRAAENKDPKVLAFEKKEAKSTLAGHPSTRVDIRATLREGEGQRSLAGTLLFTDEPVSDDANLLVFLMGQPEIVDARASDLERILGSVALGESDWRFAGALKLEEPPGTFSGVEGIAVDHEGRIYVGEWRQRLLRVYAPSGEMLAQWGREGKGEEGAFTFIKSLGALPEGGVLVLDGGYGYDMANAQFFGPDGALRKRFFFTDKGKPKYEGFLSLCIAQDGVLLTVDEGGDDGRRITIFDGEGNVRQSFAVPGATAATFDRDGNIAVTVISSDPMAGVRRYNHEGSLMGEWNLFGLDAAPRGEQEIYFKPEMIAADGCGRLYVLDTWRGAVWIYEPFGQYLSHIPLKNYLRTGVLEGLAVNASGDVFVLDRGSSSSAEGAKVLLFEAASPCKLQETVQGPKVTPIPSAAPTPTAEPTVEVTTENFLSPAPSPAGSLAETLAAWREALQMRRQAAALQEEGKLVEAADLYEKSLALYPDPAIEAHVRELRARLAEPTPLPTPEPTPLPTPEPTPLPMPEPTPLPTPEPTPLPTPHPLEGQWIALMQAQNAKGKILAGFRTLLVERRGSVLEARLPGGEELEMYEMEDGTLEGEVSQGGRDFNLTLGPTAEPGAASLTLVSKGRVFATLFLLSAEAGENPTGAESTQVQKARETFRNAFVPYREMVLGRRKGNIETARKKAILAWIDYLEKLP